MPKILKIWVFLLNRVDVCTCHCWILVDVPVVRLCGNYHFFVFGGGEYRSLKPYILNTRVVTSLMKWYGAEGLHVCVRLHLVVQRRRGQTALTNSTLNPENKLC